MSTVKVLVDGFLCTKFRSTGKAKALVEGVDNARVSNILIIPSNPLRRFLELNLTLKVYKNITIQRVLAVI